jgi:hypothetical protein
MKEPLIQIETMKLKNRLMGFLLVVKFIGYEPNFVSTFHYGAAILDYYCHG